MVDKKVTAQTPAHIAQDEAFALHLARQECIDAGVGTPQTLTDDFVRASQHERLAQIQAPSIASPRPDAPSPADAPTVIHGAENIAAQHRRKFTAVGNDEAAKSRADMVRQAVSVRCQIVEVLGDGNCGYYTVLAGAVRKAVEKPQVRQGMFGALEELCERDWSAPLAAIAGHPAHDDPSQAAGAQAMGKRTLRHIARLLDSPTPQAAVDFIENPANARQLKAAHYILRAIVAAHGGPDADGGGHGPGCALARAEDIDLAFQKLVGNSAASCAIITTRHRGDEVQGPIDEMLEHANAPFNLLVLHSNNNHYDLLVVDPPRARL